MANNLNFDGLQKIFTDSIQNFADSSLSILKPAIDGVISNVSDISKSVYSNSGTLNLPQIKLPQIKIPQIKLGGDCDCACPPEHNCPPHCIATINRTAMVGERIIVPFFVKNNCNTTKTYRVGIRELIDEKGNAAPEQPRLNKQSVILNSNQSIEVLMEIDLGKFNNGSTYTTEIVLREKDINQNICFTLSVNDNNAITAILQEEKKYKLKWQSWKDHYYCVPPRTTANGKIILTNDTKG